MRDGGADLETIMAAHGSGAVQQSREQGLVLLNIDVGGGTTKISLIDNGKIRATTAVNIGARLVAHDGADAIVRLEKGGRRFLQDLGQQLDFGAKVSDDLRAQLGKPDGASAFRCADDQRSSRGRIFT